MTESLVLIGVGLLAGILAGFLGIGGGTVMVPVMVALGLSAVKAVGTSSLAILIIALGGSWQNWRMGLLNLNNALLLGLPAIATAFLGTALASSFPEYVLLGVFGLFMLFNIYLLRVKQQVVAGAQSQSLSEGKITPQAPKPTQSRLLIGGTAGFMAGLFGVGGGVVMVPLQIILLQEEIKVAIQTSLGAIVITSLSALGWHAIEGHVEGWIGLLLGLGGLAGVQVGTRYLPRLASQKVTLMFRVVLALFAMFFFYKAWQSFIALRVV
ncbi:MAG: sulfite exporter TauE/SafE family protein [Nodosilinea sp. LVE1205-7]